MGEVDEISEDVDFVTTTTIEVDLDPLLASVEADDDDDDDDDRDDDDVVVVFCPVVVLARRRRCRRCRYGCRLFRRFRRRFRIFRRRFCPARMKKRRLGVTSRGRRRPCSSQRSACVRRRGTQRSVARLLPRLIMATTTTTMMT